MRRSGFDVIRTAKRSHEARQVLLMQSLGVTLVLDVGANIGQYAQGLRRHGYGGRIVSFEPLSEAFAALTRTSAGDPAWLAVNLALGDESGSSVIHVAGNSFSSSMLPIRPEHVDAAPRSAYVATETVEVATIDGVVGSHASAEDHVFLKVDTQGFERQVLAGGQECLGRLVGVQLELSVVELYEGSMLLLEGLEVMRDAGFRLAELQPGFAHPDTGHLLQCDGLFVREGTGA